MSHTAKQAVAQRGMLAGIETKRKGGLVLLVNGTWKRELFSMTVEKRYPYVTKAPAQQQTRKRQKKKSVTAGLYEDLDRLAVVKKRGCDWGACGRPRRRACGRPRRRDLATSLALRVQPRRGRTRTRARPSRLRAIAGRKPRDETRPRCEKAEKRL